MVSAAPDTVQIFLPVHSCLQPIYKASKTRRIMEESERRRLQNRVKHSTPGAVKVKPARKKKLVAELE